MLPNEAPDIERERGATHAARVPRARATQIERKCARVVKALICWAEGDWLAGEERDGDRHQTATRLFIDIKNSERGIDGKSSAVIVYRKE